MIIPSIITIASTSATTLKIFISFCLFFSSIPYHPFVLYHSLLPFAWLTFLAVFACYPAIQKFIINPFYEAKGERNPELPEIDNNENIFEDKGGSEAPIKLKSNDKKGKVLK